jgi:hypothetical protein
MVHDLPRAAHGKHLLAVGHARGGVHALRAVAEARREHVCADHLCPHVPVVRPASENPSSVIGAINIVDEGSRRRSSIQSTAERRQREVRR